MRDSLDDVAEELLDPNSLFMLVVVVVKGFADLLENLCGDVKVDLGVDIVLSLK